MADAVRRGSITVALLATALGCGRGGGEGSDSALAPGVPPQIQSAAGSSASSNLSDAAASTAPPCPATGRWAECTVVERLEQAGLVMTREQEPATEKPLLRQGIAYSVRNASLEVYLYPDEGARLRDQQRLPKDAYLAADQPPEPVHKPTLVTSGNLLVILDTRRERQRERITLALTAGPPQPSDS